MLNLMKLMKELWLHTILKDDSFPTPPPIRLLPKLPTRAITPLHIEVLVIGGEMSFFRRCLPRRRGGKLGYGMYVSPPASEQLGLTSLLNIYFCSCYLPIFTKYTSFQSLFEGKRRSRNRNNVKKQTYCLFHKKRSSVTSQEEGILGINIKKTGMKNSCNCLHVFFILKNFHVQKLVLQQVSSHYQIHTIFFGRVCAKEWKLFQDAYGSTAAVPL